MKKNNLLSACFHYENGELFAEKVPVASITEETPFYCYSKEAIKENYRIYDRAAKKIGIENTICYAVKTNYNPTIVSLLAKDGAGADIVSGGELYLAEKCGINSEKTVFSGVGKTAKEIDEAIAKGLMQINIESASEADLIIARAKALNKKANVAVRLNPDVDAETHEKITTGKKENKFGISFAEAMVLYRKMNQSGAVNCCGIDLHIGSQILSCAPFEKAFVRAASFIVELKDAGITVKNIDVGGGVGVQYSSLDDIDADALITEYMQTVKKTFGDMNKKIIFEPGRFLIGNAGILVTKIIHIKKNENKNFIIVDAGMNDLIRPALYDAKHAIFPVIGSNTEGDCISYSVVGPICESSDIFAENYAGATPKSGDLLAVMTTGAYGSSMSSNYNMRPLAAEILVDGERIETIRRRQTYEDILRNC